MRKNVPLNCQQFSYRAQKVAKENYILTETQKYKDAKYKKKIANLDTECRMETETDDTFLRTVIDNTQYAFRYTCILWT